MNNVPEKVNFLLIAVIFTAALAFMNVIIESNNRSLIESKYVAVENFSRRLDYVDSIIKNILEEREELNGNNDISSNYE